MLKRYILKSFYCLENVLAMKSYYWFLQSLLSTFYPYALKHFQYFGGF